MQIGATTHPGYVRQTNEDGYYASEELGVFAVADGMGGHEQGEVASHLALDAITRHANTLAQAQPTELPAHLHRVIGEANAAIISQAADRDARARMGTTIVIATLHGDRLYFAHLGDSRLYLLRGDLFTQLTRDHSVVQAMVDSGQLTPEEAAIHPLRHQITRVVGSDDCSSPEIASQALEPGDIVLLCTDGLCGVVERDTMRAILQGEGDSQQKADALTQAALQAGGPDNITAVVAIYEQSRPTPPPPAHRLHLSLWHTIGILLLLLIACVIAFAAWSYTHPIYHVRTDARDNVRLYMSWPGLPMLSERRLPDPLGMAVPLVEVLPYVKEHNLVDGIRVHNRDAGNAVIERLVGDAADALLVETKEAVDTGDLPAARHLLARAAALRADPAMVAQLELLISRADTDTDR